MTAVVALIAWGAPRFAQAPAGPLMISPIPFGETRRLNVVFAKKMKPEGITRGLIGGKPALVIVDDGGGFQVIWDRRLPYAGLPFRN